MFARREKFSCIPSPRSANEKMASRWFGSAASTRGKLRTICESEMSTVWEGGSVGRPTELQNDRNAWTRSGFSSIAETARVSAVRQRTQTKTSPQERSESACSTAVSAASIGRPTLARSSSDSCESFCVRVSRATSEAAIESQTGEREDWSDMDARESKSSGSRPTGEGIASELLCLM